MFVGAGAVRLPVVSRRGPPRRRSRSASSRDIRMPWETPAPARVACRVAAVEPPARGSREVRMPWEGGPPVPTDSFAANLVNDKSLDKVILEYLSDDGENR